MENNNCNMEIAITLGKGSSFWNESKNKKSKRFYVLENVNSSIISSLNESFSNSSILVLWNY